MPSVLRETFLLAVLLTQVAATRAVRRTEQEISSHDKVKCPPPTAARNLKATVHRWTQVDGRGMVESDVTWDPSVDVFAGDDIKYSCEGQTRLSGISRASCHDDGMYRADVGRSKTECMAICKMPPVPANTRVSATGNISGIEGMEEMAEGTELHYSCKQGCILVGSGDKGEGFESTTLQGIKCESNSKFNKPPPLCVCGLQLEIKSIDMGDQKAKLAKSNQIKIKLYQRSAAGNIQEGEGYDITNNMKIWDNHFPVALKLQEKHMTMRTYSDYFLHIEYCQRVGTLSTSCKRTASSEEPTPVKENPAVEEEDTMEDDWDWDDMGMLPFENADLPAENKDAAASECQLCIGTLARKWLRGEKQAMFTEKIKMEGPGIKAGAMATVKGVMIVL